MKCFEFDCWGPCMDLVELIQRATPPCSITISDATHELVRTMGCFRFGNLNKVQGRITYELLGTVSYSVIPGLHFNV